MHKRVFGSDNAPRANNEQTETPEAERVNSEPSKKMSPMMASFLSAIGVQPEVITQLVATLQTTAKNLEIAGQHIDAKLTIIDARLKTIEEKQAEIEHNFVALLKKDAEEDLSGSLPLNFVDSTCGAANLTDASEDSTDVRASE